MNTIVKCGKTKDIKNETRKEIKKKEHKRKGKRRMENKIKNFDRNKGITLIALVITIVLNCCGAAMA